MNLLAANTVQISINPNLPGTNSASTLPGFISNFYYFALLLAGVLAFGAIVYGGIKYAVSRGNPSAESEGKSWITNALLGLLLLAGAYVILYTINPQIISLSIPGLPSIPLPAPLPNPPTTPTAACTAPTTGNCTVSNLQTSCLSSNAQLFAGICGHESGGDAALKSGTDRCIDPSGNPQPISVGLFQINLTNSWKGQVDGKNCTSAFQGQAISCTKANGWICTTGSNGTGSQCKIIDMQLYADCVKAAQNAASNIAVACQLSNNGSNLGPWSGDKKVCGF